MQQQNWGAIITAIGTLLGAISVIYNTFCNNKKDTFNQTINELKSEIEQKQKDAEIYREKWLKAEQGNDELMKERDALRDKIADLQTKNVELKENITKLKHQKKEKD